MRARLECQCGITKCRGAMEITDPDSHGQRTVTLVTMHGTGHTIVLDGPSLIWLHAWLRREGVPTS